MICECLVVIISFPNNDGKHCNVIGISNKTHNPWDPVLDSQRYVLFLIISGLAVLDSIPDLISFFWYS